MSKHTPGPWKLILPPRNKDGELAIHMATRLKSPGVYQSAHEIVLDDLYELGDDPEKEANARLIAAAPELLAYALAEQALRDERKYSPEELRKKMGVPDECKTIGDYLDALRVAAIAKATRP